MNNINTLNGVPDNFEETEWAPSYPSRDEVLRSNREKTTYSPEITVLFVIGQDMQELRSAEMSQHNEVA